jgi:hypothetical protein
MRISPRRHRTLFARWATNAVLPVVAVTVAAVTAAGCSSSSSSSSTAVPVQPSASESAVATGCTADYCAPADWDTARASTPLTQIPPFSEPLNVVISARSTVSLAQLQQALPDWETVSTATTVSIVGIHLKCISSEMADVTGRGYVAQHVAWRLGGCTHGNELSLSGNEDHVRIWNQPVSGSKYGAWFLAASYETMCLVDGGQLTTADAHKVYAALHPGKAYHCVDGGPGSIATAHPDGYNDAAMAFAAAVVAAAKAKGWQVSEQAIAVPRKNATGEGAVPFNSTAYVLTVTS